jgi:hypothetical protein
MDAWGLMLSGASLRFAVAVVAVYVSCGRCCAKVVPGIWRYAVSNEGLCGVVWGPAWRHMHTAGVLTCGRLLDQLIWLQPDAAHQRDMHSVDDGISIHTCVFFIC